MVILVLIQLGGLGIMTFAALVVQIAGGRLSFSSQVALQDIFYQQRAAQRFRRNLRNIVLLTLFLEACGTVSLYFSLPADMPAGDALKTAGFHAVSAFCNAGFSTYDTSLESLSSNLPFMVTIASLIIMGGLGYSVLLEMIRRSLATVRKHDKAINWTLNTRVVLITSGVLILLGAGLLMVLGIEPDDDTWISHLGHAVFQSITARTAGFNTIRISNLTIPALLWLIALMFIGGSPGSCAGGIKTTSAAIWFARLRARIAQRDDVEILDRRIPVDLVRRTGLLLGVSAVYNLIGIMVLSITELPSDRFGLEDIIFEQISAFGTVGLTTGLTPALTSVGKVWIILTMYIGRLGPVTVSLTVMHHKATLYRRVEERLMIG
jgi:trk system potassium uptake protein TrkH